MATRKKKGVGIHAHGCTTCHRRYEDACSAEGYTKTGKLIAVPGPDQECHACKTGMPVAWWPEAREPKDCCIAFSRPVRTARFGKSITEKEQYALAGDHEWFICDDRQGGCSRTFPYNPKVGRPTHGLASSSRP